MPGLKEHLPVPCHDDHRRGRHHQGFHALGFRRHRDLLLQEIDEQVENHARQDGPVAGQVDPRDDEAQGNPADKEIDHIQQIDRQPRLVCPPDEDQREMPEGPDQAEDHGFPKPVHIIAEYCIQYYHRIINHLFTYLKKARDESITRKYMIITHKSRPKDNNRNRVNLNIKNKSLQKNNYELNNRNYLTKVISTTNTENKSQIINERIPYHKTTELLIDRIRFDNKSKSPDKSNNFEMFRDIKELSKKYEVINYRKNRQNFNGTLKPGNDLSFNSGSIEKNKEKEKWEKNLEKEREIKKMKELNKNNIINVNNNNKLKTKEKNNINNNSEVININNIKNKYKKLNLNLNSKNNNKTKFQMKIIKKIQTKDKKIQINFQ